MVKPRAVNATARRERVHYKASGSQTDVVQELFKNARYGRKERWPLPRRNYGNIALTGLLNDTTVRGH